MLPDGWRVEQNMLISAFAAPTAAAALAFVAAIGEAAEAANHHPDVDWRYDHVFVGTTSHDAGGRVTERDVALATRIVEIAAGAGIAAEPGSARRGA